MLAISRELKKWAKKATEKDIESLVKSPIFLSEEEGLLFLLLHLSPDFDFNTKELATKWKVGKPMAEFLFTRLAAATCYLGCDRDE